jgi:hypothetical protein
MTEIYTILVVALTAAAAYDIVAWMEPNEPCASL